MSAFSFLWYDLETFGTDTRLDRIAQFAAIRTDATLNETGEVHNLFCRPTDDYLPDPAACLVTGITPQHAHAHGLAEPAFARAVHAALAQPGTIGTGYNTLRFDDEFVRHLFWRNFIDPYAREWQNGCGRWDILDLVRCAHALRPEGIVWPQNEDGTPSLRLEHLSAANGLEHDAAHDALSDVRATIALARLVRQTQPRLFDYCLKLRSKQHVRALLTPLVGAQPFLHVSGMYGYAHGNCAIVWPLAWHPFNQNELIVWDLRQDPAILAELDCDAIAARLFVKQEDLPPGQTRLPIKTIHLNRSPVVVPQLNTLAPAQAERWQIDLNACRLHAAHARALPDLRECWRTLYAPPENVAACAPEAALYQGFVDDEDRPQMAALHAEDETALAHAARQIQFRDPRLQALLFLWRARHLPASLDADEQHRWQHMRHERLVLGQDAARSLDEYLAALDTLSETATPAQQTVLDALFDWAETIAPEDDVF